MIDPEKDVFGLSKRYCTFTFRCGSFAKHYFSTLSDSLFWIRERFNEEGDAITRICLCDFGEGKTKMYYPGDKVF